MNRPSERWAEHGNRVLRAVESPTVRHYQVVLTTPTPTYRKLRHHVRRKEYLNRTATKGRETTGRRTDFTARITACQPTASLPFQIAYVTAPERTEIGAASRYGTALCLDDELGNFISCMILWRLVIGRHGRKDGWMGGVNNAKHMTESAKRATRLEVSQGHQT